MPSSDAQSCGSTGGCRDVPGGDDAPRIGRYGRAAVAGLLMVASRPLRAHVYVSRKGNAFMMEIAILLRDSLRDAGVDSDVRGDGVPTDEDGALNLVVAPHEYFPFLGSDRHEVAMGAAAHCVLVMTEQPDSVWFRLSLAWARTAKAVLDISANGLARLQELGVEARLLPLGYHRSWDAWRGRSDDRPIDVVFMGSPTPRRRVVLAALGSCLGELDCRILLHDHLRPQLTAAPNFVVGAKKFELLARSRLILNIHRAEEPYFEWHRALGAMANGCVVLTETAKAFEPLEPSRHFAMAETGLLGEELTALLADPGRLAGLRDEAYELARTELDFVSWIHRNLPLFEAWAVRPGVPPAPAVVEALEEEFRKGLHSIHSQPAEPAAGHEPPVAAAARKVLKAQAISLIRLRRRVDTLECRMHHGVDQRVTVATSAGYGDIDPEVSVVVPLHNYADLAAQALTSVSRSDGIACEVVVVEDHSDDASRAEVEKFIVDHPEVALKLVALDANVGLPSARNIGFEEARADKVFLLDADNAVYPAALRKLSEALDSSGAAFSYSMIECFGDDRRLMSLFPWDVERLRRQPYIDAMSMIRKDVWKALGGFRTGIDELYGWEDYAFWLSLATAGYRGVLVPEVLCRYRLHGGSMINVTNLDVFEAWEKLREMFGLGPLEPLHWTV